MRSTRTISIVSGKGGVGKTTLSINLAYALAHKFKKKVLLIDSNITTSHLGISLGITSPEYTLNKVLKSKSFRFKPEKYGEMDLLLSSVSPHKFKDVDMKRIVNFVKKLEGSGKYDFILLDSAPGLGKEAISAIEASREILFVTSPLTPATIDIIRVSEIAGNLKVPSIGLVLNMVRNKPFELRPHEIERFTNVPIISSLPFDRKFLASLALKKPVVEAFPNSRISKEIVNLASVVAGEPLPPEEETGFMSWLKRLFTKKKENVAF